MIKRIELVNFMSHERTVIEPSPGLTVLIGPNNCGKSAFVAALQILCHNAKSSYVMRHGEKKCQIIVETDDGHVVEWSKTKTGSPNYLIDGEKHDRLRGGVPDRLHEILKLDKVNCEKDQFDIHFGEQKSPVFLLNDPGRASAQFFASSSDAIRLVEMQDRHKGKVRDSKRDVKRLLLEKEQLEEALEFLAPVDDIDGRLKKCEAEHQQIEQTEQKIAQTEIMIRAIEELELKLVEQHSSIEVLSQLVEPPTMKDWKRLEKIQSGIRSAASIAERSSQTAACLARVAQAPVLDDDRQLASLAARMTFAKRTHEKSDSYVRTLSRAEAVPEISVESELERLIGTLSSARSGALKLQHHAKLLDSIQPAPELRDDSGLENYLDQISKSVRDVKAGDSKLKQIEVESESAKSEIQEWVDENPACPTCGGETDVEQLIAGVQGGHQHGQN